MAGRINNRELAKFIRSNEKPVARASFVPSTFVLCPCATAVYGSELKFSFLEYS